MERIVQGDEGGSSRPDDVACPVEQVVTVVHRRYRGQRSARAPGIFGGSVAATVLSTAFGSKAVLACPVRWVGGPPGPVIRGVGHDQAPPRVVTVQRTDALWAPLLEPGNTNSSLPGRRETIATSDGQPVAAGAGRAVTGTRRRGAARDAGGWSGRAGLTEHPAGRSARGMRLGRASTVPSAPQVGRARNRLRHGIGVRLSMP